MGRAIDLFVTYRFIKLLVTPFNKTDAFKNGVIDKDGYRLDKELNTLNEYLVEGSKTLSEPPADDPDTQSE